MKHEDVEIGMKVVPFQKTVDDWGDGLSWSPNWNEYGGKEQGYLYVVGLEKNDPYAWILSNEENSFSGDYFNAEDFKPYAEEEVVSVKLTKTVDEIIFVESRDGYHKASVKQTNGNWSSIHFWYVDIDGETNHAEIDLSQFGFLIDTLTELQKQIEVKKSQ